MSFLLILCADNFFCKESVKSANSHTSVGDKAQIFGFINPTGFYKATISEKVIAMKAGWYPVPNTNLECYYDGTGWTKKYRDGSGNILPMSEGNMKKKELLSGLPPPRSPQWWRRHTAPPAHSLPTGQDPVVPTNRNQHDNNADLAAESSVLNGQIAKISSDQQQALLVANKNLKTIKKATVIMATIMVLSVLVSLFFVTVAIIEAGQTASDGIDRLLGG